MRHVRPEVEHRFLAELLAHGVAHELGHQDGGEKDQLKRSAPVVLVWNAQVYDGKVVRIRRTEGSSASSICPSRK